ncbi:ABC transporter permease [Caballeronia sp. LZ034LL]|uniref:ABC transporter permease n=1 Tax=Caballeronia sp. LZ034LL TaxID=3038567 RepID=UPI002866B399|nr:ABC transporter permease [Caballeronia sp. LZ034LL]MDR5839125.1 ABC transporter permease [Caballeronia sp. LZ034LL]
MSHSPFSSRSHPAVSSHQAPARHDLKRLLARYDVYLILLALFALACAVSPQFMTVSNLGNLLTQSAVLGILSVAQFLVVLTGGFDLSVAAVMALSSILLARYAETSLVLALGGALIASALCGLASGVSVVRGRVQPLIATLAMMGIARGLAFSVSEKSVLTGNPLIQSLGGMGGLLTPPAVIWLLLVIVAAVWLACTRAGLHCYAVGGNETTARLAGVRSDRLKIGVYTVAGLISGLAGVALVIRSSSGVPNGGIGWELDSIAAIVIGGVRLFGGEGRLLKAMAGVLIYQLIANVMNLTGIDPYYQSIIRAVVIVIAVGLSVLRQGRQERRTLGNRG